MRTIRIVSCILAAQFLSAGPASEAQAQAGSVDVQVSATPVPTAQREPIHFELVRGLILFRAKVAGRDLWMLLDNASERTLIDTAFAEAAGLKVGPPAGTMQTPVGTMPKRPVWDVQVNLPGQLDLHTPMAAVDLSSLSKFAGRKVEAVLGNDWLGLVAIVTKAQSHTLELVPSGNVNADVPFVPLSGTLPMLEISIGGKPLSVKLDLASDAMLTLTPAAWAKVAPAAAKAAQTKKPMPDGTIHDVGTVIVPEVLMGGFSRQNIPAVIGAAGLEGVDGALGAPFITDQDLGLDIKAGRLWVTAPSKP